MRHLSKVVYSQDVDAVMEIGNTISASATIDEVLCECGEQLAFALVSTKTVDTDNDDISFNITVYTAPCERCAEENLITGRSEAEDAKDRKPEGRW